MSVLLRDLRQALRGLKRRPGFAAVVAATMALGIGANAAVFSIVDALVLRPFPIPGIDRLVMLWETVPQRGEERSAVSPANFLDWRQQAESLEKLVASHWWDVNLTGVDQPVRLQGTVVTPGYLEVLGAVPVLGRSLEAAAEPEARIVVVSHQLWIKRFAADPALVGESLTLNGERYEVVGIGPPGFHYPDGSEVWAAMDIDPQTAAQRASHYLEVIGRLAPGMRVDDAQAELDLIAERLAGQFPESNRGRGVRVVDLGRALVDIGAPAFLALWQATVVFVLLIACVNVANLVLARGADRRKELSLQLALGSSRFRIVRQLLVENLLLSAIGAALATPLAWAGTELLRNALPARIRRFVVGWDQIDVDARVLAFTGAVAVLAALLFGLVPALRASRLDLTSQLREGGRGAGGESRAAGRNLLVVAEVALTLVLLVASGLTIRGTARMLHQDDGYDADGVLTLQIALPEATYGDRASQKRFFDALLERVAALPSVEAAGVVNVLPSSGANSSRALELEGRPAASDAERPTVQARVVSPGYFETLRIPLLEGRYPGESDVEESRQVAVVSEPMARRLWPDQEVLGKRLRIAGSGAEDWITVVGVVGSVTHDWFLGPEVGTFYRPLGQSGRPSMSLAVRTGADPTALAPAVRAAVLAIDPDQPVFNVSSLRRLRGERMIGLRLAATVMAIFGVIALVLSAVGIYGMMAYTVSRRTHEIGVRVALGAGRGDVLRLTVGRALLLAGAGLGIGLPLALGAGQLMAHTLFGTITLDAGTFLLFAGLLAVVALLAGYLPARGALAVDPGTALRVE